MCSVAKLYLTFCDPRDCSPPGSSIHGILQVRILEWVAISFSRGSSRSRNQTRVSRIAGGRFNLWATRDRTKSWYNLSRKQWSLKCVCVCVFVHSLSCVWIFATPWTVAYKAPLSMEFSKQEYSSGLPFPSPGDLPDPGIEPRSPTLQADTLLSESPGKPITNET